MMEKRIKDSVLRLQKGDLTAMDIEAIAFYASPNLKLGSGFGSAIAARGGMSIQEELNAFGAITTGDAVVTSAGELKADYIIHAVGPRFHEQDTEAKLRRTMQSTLRAADDKKIQRLAFPPMGSGFYGVPLDLCVRVMLEEIEHHLKGSTSLKEVVVCVLDNRELRAFETFWQNENVEEARL